MREVISKVGLVDFKSCWSVIRENGISKLLEWNNALLEVILKVGLVNLMAVRMRDEGEWVGAPIVIEKDNPKVKLAVVKEKPKSESHEIQSESHEIQSESHVNHLEMQRKTKPDVVKAPVTKAKADLLKASVAKDNHMGFKMNYMEGQELNEITSSEKYCDDEKFFELHQKYVEVFKNPIEFGYYEHSDGIDHEDDDGDDDDDGRNGNDNCGSI
ncbi:hypothetical protein Tco_0947929 [Tanacetum coccineum]